MLALASSHLLGEWMRQTHKSLFQGGIYKISLETICSPKSRGLELLFQKWGHVRLSSLFILTPMIFPKLKCHLDSSDFHIYIFNSLCWNPDSCIQLLTPHLFLHGPSTSQACLERLIPFPPTYIPHPQASHLSWWTCLPSSRSGCKPCSHSGLLPCDL